MAYPTAVTRDIAAPAEKVWALVSDLPRMGEWSPENAGGTWAKGATGPALGAVFKGTNKNGFRRWSTTVTVVACEPGQGVRVRGHVGSARGGELALRVRGDRFGLPGHRVVGGPPQAVVRRRRHGPWATTARHTPRRRWKRPSPTWPPPSSDGRVTAD